MKNFWEKLSKPFLALAPIAGYSDQPFRIICKKYGADVLYSEMVSSEAIWHHSSPRIRVTSNLYKTLKLIQFSRLEQPFVVQIFGANPEHIAFAGEYIASGKWYEDYDKITRYKMQDTKKIQNPKIQFELKIVNCKLKIKSIPSGIDVNMGCPVHDVTKTGAGAALMKNPELAVKIVKAFKKQVKNIPISVKTRLGWNQHDEILEFAKKMENAGADSITIHGRTYKEGFAGEVDWEMISKVKRQLKIPVIGNGGIDVENYRYIIEKYGLDGYMIARGALGHPWIFDRNLQFSINDLQSIKKNILKHAKLVQEVKGEKGIIEFRKHLAWYMKGRSKSKEVRNKLVRVNSYQEIVKILENML